MNASIQQQCSRGIDVFSCRLAAMVNEEFKTIMFVQFLTSTSTICFDLYRITQKDADSRLAEIAFYASCTLTQIFYYCWYGNEVKLKVIPTTKDIAFLTESTRCHVKKVSPRCRASKFLTWYSRVTGRRSVTALRRSSWWPWGVLWSPSNLPAITLCPYV